MASLLYRFGTGIRETGQALQKLGASMEGNYSFREQCTSLSLSLSLSLTIHRCSRLLPTD